MVYTMDELMKKVKPIAEKHELNTVYIFGSYARNEADENSDVDIMINREGSKIRSLWDMGGLYNDIKEELEKEFDLITEESLQQDDVKNRTPWFFETVHKDKVMIYEQ